MDRTLFLTAAFLTLFPQGLYSQPSPGAELRGVWITTAAGLDWPKTYNAGEQRASLKDMVAKLKVAHFNTIFFQVRARGDAYYRSTYEPWAENLTGTLGKDPGYDPLQFLLDEAHAAGIEVQAWVNVFKVRGPGRVVNTYPLHPALRFAPHFIEVDGEGWLDPGIPAIRDYSVRVALEIIQKYNIDGLMFDFLRYPGREFPDDDTYDRYGGKKNRDDWRRSNIDMFVSAIYDSARALKPMIKVGSAPIGIYDGDPDGDAFGAYYSYYQDSQGWLAKGKHDYLVPQIYWDIGSTKGDPDFAALARKWQKGSHGRHIYTGIGAYKTNVLREIPTEIDTARKAGALGQVYFRYENIQTFDMFGGRYGQPAFLPAMAWKDSVPPNAPRALAATELGVNVFHVEWLPPLPARDGDSTKSYSLYRSSSPLQSDPRSRVLAAVLSASATFYVDTISTPTSLRYYYTISAIDPASNEGPPSNVAGTVVREALDLKGRLARITSLTTSLPHTAKSPTLISYRLADRASVVLRLFKQGDDDSPVATLAEGIKDQGTYIVGLAQNTLAPGRYVLRLKAGSTELEQAIDFR
ncbi:MAG TPA: family 10 glycosylhydrolase [Bacteroidota bacterium]